MKHKQDKSVMILIPLLCLFIGLFIAGVKTYFIDKPQYESTAELLIQLPQSEQSQVNGDNQTTDVMFNTYKGLLESKTIMTSISQSLEKDKINESVASLEEALDVEQSTSSQVIEVSATTTNPVTSQQILKTAMRCYQEKLPTLMQLSAVKVVSQPTFRAEPKNQHHAMNLIVGSMIGLIVGLLIIFIRFGLNRVITNRHMLARLKAPVIGDIPEMSRREQSVRIHRAMAQKEEVDHRTKDLSEENEMVDQLLKQETQNYDTLIRRRRKR